MGHEFLRKVTRHSEIGLPKFSTETRSQTIQAAKDFVAEARKLNPECGVDREEFQRWVPHTEDFSRPHQMGEDIHKEHNIRHMASVLAETMFLIPYVTAAPEYRELLDTFDRPILPNAGKAAAACHDLLRNGDILESVKKQWYKRHGKQMADRIRSGEKYPDLSPIEREVAATSVEFHDVDPRPVSKHSPEDELLTLIDRAELARIVYGVGPIAKIFQGLKKVTGKNLFEKRMHGYGYETRFFPGLLEKIQPLANAMLIVSVDGIRKGLSQEEAVIFAMRELGMLKEKVPVS